MTGPGTPPHTTTSLTDDQVTVLLHALACWKDELRRVHDWSYRLMNSATPTEHEPERRARRSDRRDFLWHEAATADHLLMLLTRSSGVTVDGTRLTR